MSDAAPLEPTDLAGRVAFVTGGGRGLGPLLARALAAAGAAVAVTARTAPELRETVGQIEAAGGRAMAVTADVTDRAAVERAVAAVEGRLGPIDVLVNNAGRFEALGIVAEVDPDDWWREVEVNLRGPLLRGPLLCARAVLPGMLARRRGRIFNVAAARARRPSRRRRPTRWARPGSCASPTRSPARPPTPESPCSPSTPARCARP